MIIRLVAQDPSMNNWGLVAATVNVLTEEIKIQEMLTVVNLKSDVSTKKTVRKSTIDLTRSRQISKAIHAFLEKHQPSFTMAEVPHGSQSASAMKGYGMCLGILGSIRTPMIQLSEQECKINAVGKKSASKSEMIEWAMKLHPEADWKMRKSKGELVSVDGYNEHIADAIGALYAGLNTDQFLNAIEMAQVMNTGS